MNIKAVLNLSKCFSYGLMLTLIMVNASMAADTLKIGLGGSHTGELASHGIPSLNAAILAAEEFNAKGGLLGKKVEIVAADDQCKPELAPNAATSMLSQGVVGVVGMICSGATKAALPIFNEAKVVVISPAATNPSLTLSHENPYFMRTIGHDFIQGELAARFIGEKLKAKKVAFLHDNGDYGKGYVETTREKLKAYPDAKVVLFEAVTAGSSDYSAVVRKLRKEGAEVIVWGGYHPDASKLINNMRELEVTIPLIGPDSLKDDSFIKTAGPASEGVYSSAPEDTNDNSFAKTAAAAHVAKYGTAPGVFFNNSYAATKALLSAIETAGSTDTDKIVEALRTHFVETPIGKIKFDENGDAEGIGMAMYQVQNGVFVPVF